MSRAKEISAVSSKLMYPTGFNFTWKIPDVCRFTDIFRTVYRYDSWEMWIDMYISPIEEASRHKAWVCGRSLAGIVGSNPSRGIVVCCERCVMSGRDLCDGPITCPEESYSVCTCPWVWSWSLDNGRQWPEDGPKNHWKKNLYKHFIMNYLTMVIKETYNMVSFSTEWFMATWLWIPCSERYDREQSWCNFC